MIEIIYRLEDGGGVAYARHDAATPLEIASLKEALSNPSLLPPGILQEAGRKLLRQLDEEHQKPS